MQPTPKRLATTLLALAAACSSSPPALRDGWWMGLTGTAGLTSEFRAQVPRDLCGLAGDPAQPVWLPGDRLCFGLELFDGERTQARWLIAFTVLGPVGGAVLDTPDGPMTIGASGGVTAEGRQPLPDGSVVHAVGYLQCTRQRVRATVSEVDGTVLYDAESEVFDGLHQLGLHRYLALDAGQRQELGKPLRGTGTQQDPYVRDPRDPWWMGVLFVRLFDTFQSNQALADVLSTVADWPDFGDSLGFLFHRTYTVDWGELDGVGSIPVPGPLDGLVADARSLPFRVTVGTSPVLMASFSVVPPIGALSITAGVVGLHGYRPSTPARRFALEFLGLRRGKADGVRRR